jgi:hypothetical protein
VNVYEAGTYFKMMMGKRFRKIDPGNSKKQFNKYNMSKAE